jgi:3',5'-cyclic AMP phosphodiesterase CpdA
LIFKLAHFSDVHLGPVTLHDVFGDFRLKRLLGGLSWLRRRRIYLPRIGAALLADIATQNVDHMAFTGDLVNIAAEGEFVRGRHWLEAAAPPDFLSFTPGNHDAYVPISYDKGLGHFQPWFTGDSQKPNQFPYLRLRKNIAFIGLNTASPQSLYSAGGTLGMVQLNSLRVMLQDMRLKGFCRVVMIHHPPAPGLAMAQRSLTDSAELVEILKAEGAELVIHGHNHYAMQNSIEGQTRKIPLTGVPAATASGHHGEAAQWNLYSIARRKGQWQIAMEPHRWDPALQAFIAGDSLQLSQEAP